MLSAIQATQAYTELLEALRTGQALSGGLGLPRAARLPVVSALHGDLGAPVLLVTDRTDRALTLVDELGFWLPSTARSLFPAPNPMFYEQAVWGTVTRRDRLSVLTALAAYHLPGSPKPKQPPLIVTPVRALMARTLPRRDFLKATRTIKPGQTLPIDPLLRSWADLGYQGADIVLEPGQFSHRGGIVDIWTPAEPYPARLDFFGDEIDTLRCFDPATQRTIQPLDALIVTPAREVLPGKAEEKGIPAQDAQEYLLPLIHPAPASLLDYLPRGTLVVVDDLDVLQSHVTEIEEQAVTAREESIRESSLPADFPIPYFGWSELAEMLAGQQMVDLGYTAAPDEGSPLAQLFSPGPRFGGHLKQFIDFLQERQTAGDRQVVVSRQISRLKELWREKRSSEEAPDFREGTLSDGWLLTCEDGKRVDLLTDSEIFGWERPQPRLRRQPTAEAPEAAYADLKPGDWVVHVDHGVGRYTGLVSRTLEGLTREFLCVEYDGGDQLYVPIHQADRLTRYIGPDGSPPSPTRLGTVEWATVKSKVNAAVEEVARDLLELYARRQVAQGVAFPQDTVWQQELEASFPYVETDDQRQAIQEVKRDMEAVRPMDRLLCGDVGYGKT
ncbi:MAG: CarD family transcriptional regulator, partial [Anaerolineaceae bacterium]